MDILDGEDVEDVAGFASDIAHAAMSIADVTYSGTHGKIPVLIENWIKAERALTLLNQKDSNEGLDEVDEAERAQIEREFAQMAADLLGGVGVVEGFRVDYPGEPRGPAIRLYWNGCPTNSMGGGIIIPIP